MAELTRDTPLFHLTGPLGNPQVTRPDPRFLVYTRRIVPGLTLDDLQSQSGPAWVTAPQHPATDQALRQAGWALIMEFKDSQRFRCLYHRDRDDAAPPKPQNDS